MSDGGNCRTANIVYTARCKIHGDTYISNIEEELRGSANTGTMPKSDKITMTATAYGTQYRIEALRT